MSCANTDKCCQSLVVEIALLMKIAKHNIQNNHVILGIKGETPLAENVHSGKWEVHTYKKHTKTAA